MKVAIFIILILSCCVFLVHLKPREGFKKTFRYFKITCSSSNKTCNKPFCYLKNTRNTSTFSTGCDVIRPVFKIYVGQHYVNNEIKIKLPSFKQRQTVVSFRFLHLYRQVFAWPAYEFCIYANMSALYKSGKFDTIQTFPLVGVFNESFIKERVKYVFDRVNAEHPEKFHPCPLQRDDLKLLNFSSNNKHDFERTQPDGDYRYEHKYWNDEDENIFTHTVYEQFKTGEYAFF